MLEEGGANLVQPILRYPGMQYMEEYKRLTHSMYAPTNTAIFATYYQLDDQESTYDPNYQQTYRQQGELSGRRFNKIHNVPTIFVKDSTPITLSSAETGLNYTSEVQTSIVIDPIIGLTPHVGDYVVFTITGDEQQWIVQNISKTGDFSNPYYQCDIKVIRFRDDFEDVNVFNEYVYIEYSKMIYPLADGENYARLLKRLTSAIAFLNNERFYNDNLGYHATMGTECFPQLETILSTHQMVAPPSKVYLGEPYDVLIPRNSVIMLYCMFNEFDGSKRFIDRVNPINKPINPRINIWNKYHEWILQSKGTHAFAPFFYKDTRDYKKATKYMRMAYDEEEYIECPIKDTPIGFLADEIIHFFLGEEPIAEYPDHTVCTNLFEGVVEYSQTLKEILSINERAVKFS